MSSIRLVIAGLAIVVAAGCGNRESATSQSAKKPEITATKQPKQPFIPVDACTLLTKAEVEAVTHNKVLEPVKEQAANLVTCSYGDPTSPQVGGKALGKILSLAVFTGEEGAYYKGAVAQAKDTYEMAHKNAGTTETVAGLGESAYWDDFFHTMTAYKTKYLVTVTVTKADGLALAKTVMSKVLGRLP